MDHLPALGTAIGEIVKPTMELYAPLLIQNGERIRSVPKQTHQFGSQERQQLDLYTPPKPSIVNGRQTVFIFLYGGGLVAGHKTLPGYAEDLCHANIASFYALKYGYTVVVPDYRLVGTHDDAVFPSGGEDLALAVEWLFKNQSMLGDKAADLFIMGNSAGGVHLSTFLLHPSFAATRAKVLAGDGLRLQGAILLSVPFHFGASNPGRAEMMKAYYGEDVGKTKAPLGLLKSAREKGTIDFVASGMRLFVLNGTLDPFDEILLPRDDFIKEWIAIDSDEARRALAVDMMLGHNHISPVPSLGTGTDDEEAWGHQVASFCENIRKFKPTVR